MDYHTFLREIPKVELHCHLEGAVRASTFVELAVKNGVELPPKEKPEDLYIFDTIDDFFVIYRLVCNSLKDADDFRRVTYETLEDGAADGLKYREMFWSPQVHLAGGVPYKTMIEGFTQAINDAEKDFGVQCRMIAGIALYSTPNQAVELVEAMLDYPNDIVIGVGMDFGEKGNPPEKLLEAYKLAGKGGLHRCGHTGQLTPASNIEILLDKHGVERIDHGYSVVLDDRISKRCAEEGVSFSVCPTATQIVYFPWDLGKHPIREMVKRGLKITIGSDDPTMCWTSIGLEYILLADHIGYSPEEFKQFVMNSIDACWIDEDTKRQWRKDWSRVIDEKISQIEGIPGLQFGLDEETYLWNLKAHKQPGLDFLASMKTT